MYAHEHTYMHTYTDVRMCVYTYICVCLCINTHTHIQCLSAIQPPFTTAAKQWLQQARASARADPQVAMQASRLREVRANLPRFIQYKKGLGL